MQKLCIKLELLFVLTNNNIISYQETKKKNPFSVMRKLFFSLDVRREQ